MDTTECVICQMRAKAAHKAKVRTYITETIAGLSLVAVLLVLLYWA
jgi:hypothetical protein